MCFHNTYGLFSCLGAPVMPDLNQPTGPAEDSVIEPTAPPAVIHDLLERVLGTRARDLAANEEAQRNLLAASPEAHRRLLRWLAVHEPESPLLSVGLALLATGADPAGRRLVANLIEGLPLRTVADTV